MSRYHINPETGRPNICRAQTPQSCKFYTEQDGPPPHFDTKEEAREYYEESREEDLFGSTVSNRNKKSSADGISVVSGNASHPSFSSLPNFSAVGEFSEEEISNAIKVSQDYGDMSKEGVYMATLEGEAVGEGFFDDEQVAGTINHNNLDKNSYRQFGFISAEERLNVIRNTPPITDSIDVKSVRNSLYQDDIQSIVKDAENNKDHDHASSKVLVMKGYTDDSEWVNGSLYRSKEDQKEFNDFFENQDSVYTAKKYSKIDLNDEDGEYRSYEDGGKRDSNDLWYAENSTKVFSSVVRTMDDVIDTSNGLQKTVYRGINSDGKKRLEKQYGNNIDNIPLGQEMRFDTFSSTSQKYNIASRFSNNLDTDKGTGIILEIKTASGMPISSISRFEEEREVLLPRGSRFMVVGKQKTNYKNLRPFGPINPDAENDVTVLQLVEINEKGEIVNHNNIKESAEMRKEYNNENSVVKRK